MLSALEFLSFHGIHMRFGSALTIISAHDYRLQTGVRSPAEDFSSSLCVQTSSETHPVQWVPRAEYGRSVTLNTHPHLVQRSRMSSNYTPLPLIYYMACSGTALLKRQTNDEEH
jgi:hypothetical protein